MEEITAYLEIIIYMLSVIIGILIGILIVK